MRKRILMPCILALAFLSSASHAFYPVDGWWLNPPEAGRGINIEMQNDIMFLSFFHYDVDGSPLWWTSAGQFDAQTWQYDGQWDENRNGQCPGCTFTPPDYYGGAGGSFQIQFHGPTTATMTWDGGSMPLQRFYWGFDTSDPLSFLYGDFHFTFGALGVYFGDRLRMYIPVAGQNGKTLVGGHVIGSTSRVAVGDYFESEEIYALLVDASTSYYQLYLFDMTKDRIEGQQWTYLKDEAPSGSGLPVTGHRLASRAYAESGVGPHSTTEPPDVRNDESLLHADHQAATALDLASISQPNAAFTLDQAHVAHRSLTKGAKRLDGSQAPPIH